jgi:DNA-binding GntR family transcriptional regulator
VRAAAARLAAAHPDDPALLAAAQAVTAAADSTTARQAFSELSRLLVLRLATTSGAPRVLAYHCPMWEGYAWWIQLKPGISNPYMGQSMPTCGEETSLKAAIKAAGS